jgi:hypothetical protein
LKTEYSRNAIQTLHSNLFYYFLKDTESIYLNNKKYLFTEQRDAARESNYKEINDQLVDLKATILYSVGDEEPSF